MTSAGQPPSWNAFTTLVNQYDRNIYRLALNITGNREDAEDVLQEAFLKALQALPKHPDSEILVIDDRST